MINNTPPPPQVALETRFAKFGAEFVDCFMRLDHDKFDTMLAQDNQFGKEVSAIVIRILEDGAKTEKTIESRQNVVDAYKTGFFDVTSDCVLKSAYYKPKNQKSIIDDDIKNGIVIKCKAKETKQVADEKDRYNLKTKIKLELAQENPDNSLQENEGQIKITRIWQSTHLKKLKETT